MAVKITNGTMMLKEGTFLPEGLRLQIEPYLKGWSLVENLDSSGMDRKLCDAGWTFFFMAGEVKAMAFGSASEETTRRAIKKAIATMNSDRFNCLEISEITADTFIGMPCVTVAAHPRHIQESIYLFHLKRVAEWDQERLAAI